VVSKFTLNGRSFYFKTIWGSNHFDLVLTDGKYGWSGKADKKYIQESLKPQGMSFEEYIKLTKEALTHQDISKKKYSCSVKQGDNTNEIMIIWTIKIDEQETDEDISMKGSLKLVRQNDIRIIIQEKLDFLIDKVKYFNEENVELKRVNKLVSEQRSEALSQIDNLIIEKQCFENEVYSKFVALLNEKKKEDKRVRK